MSLIDRARAYCSGAVALLSVMAAPATADFISINPRSAYLRLNADPGNRPALAIDLAGLSFSVQEGDLLRLERLGDFFNGRSGGDTRTGMIGVFSSSDTLHGPANRFRVPGALDAGDDFVTPVTFNGDLPTDILEDFRISGGPASGISSVIVRVPVGAAYLFITANDDLYGDNADPDGDFGVRITSVPEPAGLLMSTVGMVGLALGALKFRKARPGRSRTPLALGLVAFCVLMAGRAGAGTIEDFDSPSGTDRRVLFDASPIYDGIREAEAPGLVGGDNDGNNLVNGNIVNSSNQVVGFDFGELIPRDQGGTGFFLMHGTVSGGPSYVGDVWGTIDPIAVAPGTVYEFSFFLANAFAGNAAVLEPFINGVSIGDPVSAVGNFASGGWQRFAFTWNSGTAATADLGLRNLRGTGNGNDFGIDTIGFTPVAVPEPASVALLATGVVGLVARHRRRGPGATPAA